jgi:group I intron endonuclease
MDDTAYLIYKLTGPSGKSYIGQTKDYDRRCREHQISTNCRLLSRAIKKHRWDNFQHEILMEGLSLDEANHWEPALILEYNTLSPNGYNLMTGGMNSSHSDETRAKISDIRTGIPKSDETRAKMSEAKKAKLGVPRSEETRANMSNAHLGMLKSDATKAKMSASRLGKKRGPYKKKVLVKSPSESI